MGIFGRITNKHSQSVPTVGDVDTLNMKFNDSGFSSQFRDFLKTVISFTGELSSLTCPAFFLNGLSLLEYGCYWGDHPSCFASVAKSEDPKERMIAVTRWFVSTLWGSYASRCTNGLTEKKPYNPILGEQFYCHLGNIKCICEQVSHHPPVSAFYLEDEEHGISLNGHCGQKSKFKGTSIKVEQVGRAILYLKKYDEQYVIDYPDLLIRGVLTGACYLELSGTCTISCSNNTKATIEFIPKPWFGGDYNLIKGSLFMNSDQYATLSGKWSGQSFYTVSDSTKKLLFDADTEPMAKRVTAPVKEQKENESHRIWGKVTEALKEKNYQLANIEKSKIEEWQRRIRKEREQDSSKGFTPVLFTFESDNDDFDPYVKSTKLLLKDRIGNQFVDNGSWTYNNSLHRKE
ncbi:Oxysterol-binding protein [Backusella circina FSU 941]|nr:Oxysterol-binding protein [Backusella circina FSU 941]